MLREKGLGSEHPESRDTSSIDGGEILNVVGRRQEARISFERAVDIWRGNSGKTMPRWHSALTDIGSDTSVTVSRLNASVPLERATNGFGGTATSHPRRSGRNVLRVWPARCGIRVRARQVGRGSLLSMRRSATKRPRRNGNLPVVENWLRGPSSTAKAPSYAIEDATVVIWGDSVPALMAVRTLRPARL